MVCLSSVFFPRPNNRDKNIPYIVSRKNTKVIEGRRQLISTEVLYPEEESEDCVDDDDVADTRLRNLLIFDSIC